jgi:site-specific DNA-methyltransferase (adenine-specific)
MKKHIYERTSEEIDEYIKTNLPIKKLEKDKYGEVFTPPELINKLLDLYPKQIWSNPDIKWLEPSAGVGFIMIMIYQRLMNGLKNWETNDKKRSNHIIEKMLYMVELNVESCKKCKSIFGPTANIICNNFLEDFDKNNSNLMFDCIIGNPPFQDDYGLTEQ